MDGKSFLSSHVTKFAIVVYPTTLRLLLILSNYTAASESALFVFLLLSPTFCSPSPAFYWYSSCAQISGMPTLEFVLIVVSQLPSLVFFDHMTSCEKPLCTMMHMFFIGLALLYQWSPHYWWFKVTWFLLAAKLCRFCIVLAFSHVDGCVLLLSHI